MTHRKRLAILAGLVFGIFAARSALANSCVWTGSTSADWSDFRNWQSCGLAGVPGNSDSATIPLAGAPPVIMAGSSVNVAALTVQPGAVLTVTSGGMLALPGGMTGGGNLVVQNGANLDWSGGTMDGAGTTTAAGGSAVTLSGNAKTLGRTLTLGNGGILSGGGALTILPGVVLHNLGTLDIQNDAGILGPGGQINNSGTLQRSTSSAVALIESDVNNNGAISVTSGGLSFTGNTVNSGTVNATGTISYDGGTNTFDNTVTADNLSVTAGTATFNGTTTVNTLFLMGPAAAVVHIHAAFASNQTTQLWGGHMFIDSGSVVSSVGNMTVASPASLTMMAFVPVAATGLDLEGVVEGSEDLNVNGFAHWGGGTQLGPGATRLFGTSVFGGPSLQNVGRDIDIFGPSTFLSGSIAMPSIASLIRVIAPVTITSLFAGVTGASGIFRVLPGGSLNAGPGGGPLTFECLVTNDGDVTFGDRPTTVASYFQTSGSTTLQLLGSPILASTPFKIAGGLLSGLGTIEGDLIVSGTATVSPGSPPGSAGNIHVTGNYTQSAPAQYQADSVGTPPTSTDLVVADGTASIGGPFQLTLGFTPDPNTPLTFLTYAQRFGTFSIGPLPPLSGGLSWTPRYAAHAFSLVAQKLQPVLPLRLDAHVASAGVHNLNQVLEPGERVLVEPVWSNPSTGPFDFSAFLGNFTGPSGATYTISKSDASYGTIPAGQSAGCFSATGNCYEVSVDNPATRPAAHWDATVDEFGNDGNTVGSWTLHIGNSFGDVAPTAPQYRFVETLFHNLITSGCGGGAYCPSQDVTRAQMSVFLLKAKFGASYVPPPATLGVFADVPSNGFAADFIENLYSLGVTGGCGGGNFCPNSSATRAQMAVFLLKTDGGPSYTPPACSVSPFTDVPCSNGFAPWIVELVSRGITAGCAPGLYCPGSSVTRGQMAVFLTTTFLLTLNGI